MSIERNTKMPIEIEKKYRLTAGQFAELPAVLADLGADFAGEDFEENTLYGGGILAAQQAVLRVRKIDDKTILTYKRRIRNELAVKQQIEHETEVANAEEIEKIIASLGFTAMLIYEKRRKTWTFRQTEIVLDELPFGLFMEIEGSIMQIAETEMFLGAEDFEVVHETYPNLTAVHGTRRGDLIEARFTGE